MSDWWMFLILFAFVAVGAWGIYEWARYRPEPDLRPDPSREHDLMHPSWEGAHVFPGPLDCPICWNSDGSPREWPR